MSVNLKVLCPEVPLFVSVPAPGFYDVKALKLLDRLGQWSYITVVTCAIFFAVSLLNVFIPPESFIDLSATCTGMMIFGGILSAITTVMFFRYSLYGLDKEDNNHRVEDRAIKLIHARAEELCSFFPDYLAQKVEKSLSADGVSVEGFISDSPFEGKVFIPDGKSISSKRFVAIDNYGVEVSVRFRIQYDKVPYYNEDTDTFDTQVFVCPEIIRRGE